MIICMCARREIGHHSLLFCKIAVFFSLFFNSPQDQLAADMYSFSSKEGDYARYFVTVSTLVNKQTSVFVGMFAAVKRKAVEKQPDSHFHLLIYSHVFKFLLTPLYISGFFCCCFHSSWKLRLITTESL